MDALALPLLSASKKYQVVLLWWGEKKRENIKRKMMLHEHKINNADSFRAA